MATRDLWVLESPKPLAVGEAAAFTMDFSDIGTPTGTPTVIAYDSAGVDVSASVLSGSTSISGNVVTLKLFTPASAQTYRLVCTVTIASNTRLRALDVDVYSLTPASGKVTPLNAYISLAELKNALRAVSTDVDDDVLLVDLIEQACRLFDGETHRTFYPRVETRSFNVPPEIGRELRLDNDLLSVITLTNGDDTTIASTEYDLLPKNYSPKYAIKLKESSLIYWTYDANGNTENVIDVLGFWAYREYFDQRGWKSGGTLNEAGGLNATDTTFTMTVGHSLAAGQIVKIDNEVMVVSAVAVNDVVVTARGENGSTAATHANGATVSYWNVQEDVAKACRMIAVNTYRNRYGQNPTGPVQITPSGLVITPQDVPEAAARIIRRYQRNY